MRFALRIPLDLKIRHGATWHETWECENIGQKSMDYISLHDLLQYTGNVAVNRTFVLSGIKSLNIYIIQILGINPTI